jgi:hypothetical protein
MRLNVGKLERHDTTCNLVNSFGDSDKIYVPFFRVLSMRRNENCSSVLPPIKLAIISMYRDQLRAGRSGDRISSDARDLSLL